MDEAEDVKWILHRLGSHWTEEMVLAIGMERAHQYAKDRGELSILRQKVRQMQEREETERAARQRVRERQLEAFEVGLALMGVAALDAQKRIIDESITNIGATSDAVKDIPPAVRSAIAAALQP